MITTILVMTAVFLAGTAIMLAAGMLLRDILVAKPDMDQPEHQLIFPRPLPEQGLFSQWFYQLLEESGTDLETPAALAIVAGFAIVGCATPLILFDNYLAAAGCTLLAVIIPLAWWAFQGWWRCGEIRTHLAESLQMVADSVRAGHTLEEAAALVAREIKGPLGVEFEQCAQQLKLGQTPVAVLMRMSRRIPLSEFRVFATAVVVHARTGGNLAMLTERMAAASRDRQEFSGHLNAVTAGSRLSAVGLVVGAIVAVGLLSWIEPDYMNKFITTDVGPSLVGLAAGLQLVGALWVWNILRVNY